MVIHLTQPRFSSQLHELKKKKGIFRFLSNTRVLKIHCNYMKERNKRVIPGYYWPRINFAMFRADFCCLFTFRLRVTVLISARQIWRFLALTDSASQYCGERCQLRFGKDDFDSGPLNVQKPRDRITGLRYSNSSQIPARIRRENLNPSRAG